MNGASDLAVAVFGDAGRHARTTIGVPSLPLDAAVEVEGHVRDLVKGFPRRGRRGLYAASCPTARPTLTLTLHPQIAEIPAAEWDACAGDGNPFVSHAFLARWRIAARPTRAPAGCRSTRCCASGERIVAAAPMYAKSHSYGEYVFDHGWANAFERGGRQLLPEAAGRRAVQPGARAAPAGPATGIADRGAWARRWRRPAASWASPRSTRRSAPRRSGRRWAGPAGCSGSARSSTGRTRATGRFDDFLGALARASGSAIRRERRDANAAGLEFVTLRGHEITAAALGRVLQVLHLDRGPQMGQRLSDAQASSRCCRSGWATGWC